MNAYHQKNSEYLSDKDFYTKPKKFVFSIDPENINFIESLSSQEKYDLINELISKYKLGKSYDKTFLNKLKSYRKIFFIALVVIAFILTIVYLISITWNLTQINNVEMKHNFQKILY